MIRRDTCFLTWNRIIFFDIRIMSRSLHEEQLRNLSQKNVISLVNILTLNL